jgi:hypothetical protein
MENPKDQFALHVPNQLELVSVLESSLLQSLIPSMLPFFNMLLSVIIHLILPELLKWVSRISPLPLFLMLIFNLNFLFILFDPNLSYGLLSDEIEDTHDLFCDKKFKLD